MSLSNGVQSRERLKPEDTVVIYTDGACDPNPGPGGWAAILRRGRHEKVLTGSAPEATNNRMELQAALSALQALKRPCRVTLHTDSAYLQRGITEWLPSWQQQRWRTSDRRPVQNQDLWQALAEEVERHYVEWRWVRGHARDPLNLRVDHLARAAIARIQAPRPANRDEPTKSRAVVQLFTRASCLGPTGLGGWGVVVRRGDTVTSLSGSARETTPNELELRAAIQGLASLNRPSQVHVYTVSKYLHQGITRWAATWQAHGWRTKEGQPVRHKPLWLALQEALSKHHVEWHQLPTGEHPVESEQAAALAAQAARMLQQDAKATDETPV